MTVDSPALPTAPAFPIGAAPGWRPDPARPGLERLWDGSHWTDHVRPIDRSQPERAALRATPGRALAVVVQVLLGAGALLNGALLIFSLYAGNALAVWRIRPEGSSATDRAFLARLGLTLDACAVTLWVVTGVLFLLWLVRRYRDPRVNPTLLRRTPTMAVLSWFVPLLNLWWPAQCLKDLWHASRPEARSILGPVRQPMPAVMWPWWLGWLARSVIVVEPFYFALGVLPPATADFGLAWEPFGFGAAILSAVCLVVVMNQIEDALVAPDLSAQTRRGESAQPA